MDWGDEEWAAGLRQEKMLNVIEKPTVGTVSLLDVGCGYGALADLIKELKINIDYVGIDVVPEMVLAGEKRHPESVFRVKYISKTPDYNYGLISAKIFLAVLSVFGRPNRVQSVSKTRFFTKG